MGGDHFGGVHLTHPYITGKYKKIGVCDGRSLYQVMIMITIMIMTVPVPGHRQHGDIHVLRLRQMVHRAGGRCCQIYLSHLADKGAV